MEENMKLKTLVIAAALTLPVAAMADDMSGSNPFAGAYVGAGIGFGSVSSKLNDSDVGTITGVGTITTYGSLNAGKTGFAGHVFGGYNFAVASDFLVGVEAEFGMNSQKAEGATYSSDGTTVTTLSSINTKLSNDYGLNVNFGYMLNQNNMVYVGLGYNRAKLKATGYNNQTISGEEATATINSNVNGVKFQIGAQQSLDDGLSLRENMSYTSYNSKSASTTVTDGAGITDVVSFKVKPKALAATVNLVYNFDM